MEKDYILDIQDLVVHYETEDGLVEAVNGMNIKLEKGKTIGLVGETGSGKTTTALSVLGLVPNPPGKIKNGKIILDNQDVLALTERELEKIRGNIVSMIFQDPMTSLNPVLTVGDQIAEVIQVHNDISKDKAMEIACEMLEMVGIPRQRVNDYPHQFSGGMKQRVVISIALACKPQLLIADEPTTALDVTIQAQILQTMQELKEKLNTSMVMITHDLGIVAECCDEVSVIYGGQIVEHGTLEDIFDRTMHPYTEGLFNSLPSITERRDMLKPIRGTMPDPTDLPIGCIFAPRCDYATEACHNSFLEENTAYAEELYAEQLNTENQSAENNTKIYCDSHPRGKWISDTHFVRCIRYNEPDFKIEKMEGK